MVSFRPLIAAFVFSIFAIAIAVSTNATLLDGAGSLTRWTARFGLPFFLIAFTASSLHYFIKTDKSKSLLQQRRHWGLGFAWLHSVHLVGFTLVIINDDFQSTFAELAPGGMVYLLMYLMVFTSNDWSMRRLGRYWRWLHLAGSYALWAGFAVAYTSRFIGNTLGDDTNRFDFMAVILLYASVILRYAVWRSRRIRRG